MPTFFPNFAANSRFLEDTNCQFIESRTTLDSVSPPLQQRRLLEAGVSFRMQQGVEENGDRVGRSALETLKFGKKTFQISRQNTKSSYLAAALTKMHLAADSFREIDSGVDEL